MRRGKKSIIYPLLSIISYLSPRGAFLVPLTGLEPVQYRYRGILSPLCLPIPPQRQVGRNIVAYFASCVKNCLPEISRWQYVTDPVYDPGLKAHAVTVLPMKILHLVSRPNRVRSQTRCKHGPSSGAASHPGALGDQLQCSPACCQSART